MQIVVDTSCILAVLLDEIDKPAIVRVTTGVEIIAPASLLWEVGNALSANIKRKRITSEQALQAVKIFQNIDIRLIEIDMERAVRIATTMNCYAYDAYMLVCAIIQKAPLLSLDVKMVQLAQASGIQTVKV